MLTVTDGDIAISSDQESSFKKDEGNREARNCG
jgi:hypothetical protein